MISASAWRICAKITSQDMPWLERQMNSKHTKEKLAWFSLSVRNNWLLFKGSWICRDTQHWKRKIWKAHATLVVWKYFGYREDGADQKKEVRWQEWLAIVATARGNTTNLYWNCSTSKLCKTGAKSELNANHYFYAFCQKKMREKSEMWKLSASWKTWC